MCSTCIICIFYKERKGPFQSRDFAGSVNKELFTLKEVGQLGEVWENLHSTLTRGLAKAREARRAQAQLEVIDKNMY